MFPSLPVKNMDQLTANISIKRKLFSGCFIWPVYIMLQKL
uniref:Uncharacterized protein n=1 Tax=Klebsiella pneumoniae TaxID=573 RepID=A0A8E6L6V6_KLEPN|nr:hypothetical protein [Klebsiella pneumoniae]